MLFYSEGTTYDTCLKVGFGVCFSFGMSKLPEKKPEIVAA